MSIPSLQNAKTLKAAGAALGRAGMSERVIAAVKAFDGSYKGAMRLAGRLKAISQMASADEYWREQVDHGFRTELHLPAVPSHGEVGEQ
jgi:hypothetical protein